MGESLKKWAIPIVAGLVILYLIFRFSKGGSASGQPRTSYILQSQGAGDAGAPSARESSRIAGFQGLATVAGQKIAASAQRQSEELQLTGLKESLISGQEIERIKSGLQRELGLFNLDAIVRQIAGQEEAYRIASADRRYDVDAQLAAVQRGYQAQESLFTTQARAAWDTLQAQIAAVSSVGGQYRGASLERQGTVLNALASIWGQRPYSYTEAFGGPRPPPFLQQLGGFIGQIGQAAPWNWF